jgi:hypothetical protein
MGKGGTTTIRSSLNVVPIIIPKHPVMNEPNKMKRSTTIISFWLGNMGRFWRDGKVRLSSDESPL